MCANFDPPVGYDNNSENVTHYTLAKKVIIFSLLIACEQIQDLYNELFFSNNVKSVRDMRYKNDFSCDGKPQGKKSLKTIDLDPEEIDTLQFCDCFQVYGKNCPICIKGCLDLKLDKINFLFFTLRIFAQYLQDLYDESYSSKNVLYVRDGQYNTGYYRQEVRSLLELRVEKKWAMMACQNFIKFCKKQPPNYKMKSCSQCCNIRKNKNLFLRPLRRKAVIRIQRQDLQSLQALNHKVPIRIKILKGSCPSGKDYDLYQWSSFVITTYKVCGNLQSQEGDFEPYEFLVARSLRINFNDRILKTYNSKLANEWKPVPECEYCTRQQVAWANRVGCDY